MPVPAFLQKSLYTNGRVRDDHAPKSVLRFTCSSEQCGGELREFQIVSVDTGKRVSVFRCVMCDSRVEVRPGTISAEAEKNNKKESKNVRA
jgi:hypothetical protein